jgi:hypothetical protein
LVTGDSAVDGNVFLRNSFPGTVVIGGEFIDVWAARAAELPSGFDGTWGLTVWAICANVDS